ncbi:hypothetical protein [Candidatus Methanoperedens nitratireducens]|uniref:Uncharacterized protein n=1 Tax=Candidatus Methanoperedens nitratireducens TaxID=1392998 RepID=A0A284VTX8_9EURY|nr:hypothetical protein [Candidatus Methanoperedens nitroreducens]SNQ62754.1 hypothetical protein MNV_860012 [Candidatus Methanoperedens nitroreducens]
MEKLKVKTDKENTKKPIILKAKVKTKRENTLTTVVMFIISLYMLSLGLFNEIKTPYVIFPFSAMFLATGFKLCKIEIDILQEIKRFK